MIKIVVEFTAKTAGDIDTINKGVSAIAFGLYGEGVSVESGKVKAAKPAAVEQAEEKPQEKAPAKEKAAKAPKAAKSKESSEDAEITMKDVRTAFSNLLESLGDDKGQAEGKKILKKHGAKQILDLDKEKYADVISEIKTLIEENEDTANESDEDADFDIDGEEDED